MDYSLTHVCFFFFFFFFFFFEKHATRGTLSGIMGKRCAKKNEKARKRIAKENEELGGGGVTRARCLWLQGQQGMIRYGGVNQRTRRVKT
jgi:hypothetical protein